MTSSPDPVYDLPMPNNADFVIGDRMLPPPDATTQEPLRVQKYCRNQYRLAIYLQYWIRKELQAAWAAELQNMTWPESATPGTDVCPITSASFIPIEQWNQQTKVTFPHLNVLRVSHYRENQTVETESLRETYAITWILPPATTLDAADLFQCFVQAVSDVIAPAISRNTINDADRYFTDDNFYDVKCSMGRLRTPATAENWLNCVAIDLQMSPMIYNGGGAGDPDSANELDSTTSTPSEAVSPFQSPAFSVESADSLGT